MSNKDQLNSLLEQHKSFLVYGIILELETILTAKWHEKKGTYEIEADGKTYYSKEIEEMLQIGVRGHSFEKLLEIGNILEICRDMRMEDKIVQKYMKPQYQERCRYILSAANKKRESKFSDYLGRHPEALKENRVCRISEEEYSAYTQIYTRFEKEKVWDRHGYLITGFLKDYFYSGTMYQLTEYLCHYVYDDLSILYCADGFGVLQFSVEYEKGRYYWLLP